jgi:hypothetical protein
MVFAKEKAEEPQTKKSRHVQDQGRGEETERAIQYFKRH